MTIQEALHHGVTVLKEANVENAMTETVILLAHTIQKDKSYLWSHAEFQLPFTMEETYLSYLKQRSQRIPLQYITGLQEFMSLTFSVSQSVLIPRHDTETLVEFVIDYAQNYKDQSLRILDIGTGSGCIAISLANYIKHCSVIGVDISHDALQVAFQNLTFHQLQDKVTFMQGNLFEPLQKQTFDIIVSNPPYIPLEIVHTLEPEVKDNEPLEALTDGFDGLSIFQKIINTSIHFLNPFGILVLEIGIDQADIVENMVAAKFSKTKIIQDVNNIDRVIVGYL